MAYSASSRIWYTVSHGILNEIYYPTIDRPQTRDMEFLLTDGETFVHEEKRDLERIFEYIDGCSSAVRLTNSDPQGRYKIIKEIIADPHHPVVLMRVRFEGDERPAVAHESLRAAGASFGCRRSRQFRFGAGSVRQARAVGVEERPLPGHGGELWIRPRQLWLCGQERRLAGPDGQLPDGLAVRLRAPWQYCPDRRDRH